MIKPKKLIEVAMPVKEISAESVRDKSIRHGHISTLHLWWARRPLPVCRAVVFASLVPDPLDENCPQQFREAVEILLGKNNDLPGDPYRPYDDIPHTAIVDKMEDNLRNRLMMFIGKFSDAYVTNEKQGKKTPAKNQLQTCSLIKWDNKNDEKIIGRARKLIFVSHNAKHGKSTSELLDEYHELNDQITQAEQNLYGYENRHIITEEVKKLEQEKDNAIKAFLDKMPKVFDPFAGGGAIPLEAARLGCNSFGNDINPVAHIIQKGSCEFPQIYGKQILFSKNEFLEIYGKEELNNQILSNNVFGDKVTITNRLAHDVEFFANKIITQLNSELGNLYYNSGDKDVFIYFLARTAECSNPSCKSEIPLLNKFYLSKRRNSSSNNWVYLSPIIKDSEISFEIKKGVSTIEPWVKRKNLKCPVCENITSVKELKSQFSTKKINHRLLAIIEDSKSGRKFRLPTNEEISISQKKFDIDRPYETLSKGNSRDLHCMGWGVENWGDIFTDRQLVILNGYIKALKSLDFSQFEINYSNSIKTYLSILLNRIAARSTSIGVWHVLQETVEHPFGRQSVPMKFDYPEINPFTSSAGGIKSQLRPIIQVINSESKNSFKSSVINSSSGERAQFKDKELDVTITDPPYYDAIAYADLSDFFYVWLKRSLIEIYPIELATPLTPKKNECTALKHHHGSSESAKVHFENKLQKIFEAIQIQTKDVVSIMFAHQSTVAWTTLCNSLLNSNLNITGSWPIDTEVTVALKADKATLASSVTVSAIPLKRDGIEDYKIIKNQIQSEIKNAVSQLYLLGFRGSDLLTACFGKAVSVFGQYNSVEKADGSKVTVAELLEMAREAAFNAIVSDIKTDELTKFYIGWLNLFGFSEAIHDDVRRISQIGLSVEMNEIYNQSILIKDGDKGVLGSLSARIKVDIKLGLRPVKNNDIDIAHRLMYLFDSSNAGRSELLDYIANKAPTSEASVWRVLNSLAELLPKSKDMKDQELAIGLLQNQENLLRESKNRKDAGGVQAKLGFE